MGKPLPPSDFLPGEALTVTSPLGDFRRKPQGKRVYRMFQKAMSKNNPLSAEGVDETTALMMERMMADMPIGKMMMFSNGALSEDMILGMVDLANGKIIKGLARIQAARKKRKD